MGWKGRFRSKQYNCYRHFAAGGSAGIDLYSPDSGPSSKPDSPDYTWKFDDMQYIEKTRTISKGKNAGKVDAVLHMFGGGTKKIRFDKDAAFLKFVHVLPDRIQRI